MSISGQASSFTRHDIPSSNTAALTSQREISMYISFTADRNIKGTSSQEAETLKSSHSIKQ
ncbi:hypothetical protein ACT3UA_16130 [Glutamicibacter sp. 363]|uniref:hypothetical protein n=1 Tax=Glutamicibacter sp. 363 TaxID=3457731 RepID=UPI0040345CAB